MCVNYQTLHDKQPNVASGVWPEMKPLSQKQYESQQKKITQQIMLCDNSHNNITLEILCKNRGNFEQNEKSSQKVTYASVVGNPSNIKSSSQGSSHTNP